MVVFTTIGRGDTPDRSTRGVATSQEYTEIHNGERVMASSASSTTKLHTEIVNVTPAMADEWLATMGPNRRLNEANVSRLELDMAKDNWFDNGDPIRFDRKGRLRDGQHRLQAIVRSGRTYPFQVIRNLDEKALQIVDTGKQRSFSDILTMREGEGAVNATLARKIAATAKLVWHYENGSILSSGQAVSHSELERVLRKHRDLPRAVETVAAGDAQPHAALAFVYVLASEIAPRKAKQWLTQVQEGENLRKGMPAYELRSVLISQRGSGAKRQLRGPFLAALAVQSFNAFNRGDTRVALEWRRTKRSADQPFPTIGE